MNFDNRFELLLRLRSCKYVATPARPDNKTSFNMRTENFDCGSPACVAGHCADLMGREYAQGWKDIADYLEISEEEASIIHQGRFSDKYLNQITLSETIYYLERID